MRHPLILFLFGLAGMIGCAVSAQSEAEAPAKPITVALQWHAKSQFAGFYLARELGLYRAEGLSVEFIHADAQRSSLDLLLASEADAATAFLSDALLTASSETGEGASGKPSIALILQLVQRSNLMLLAWKAHGINSLQDLNGKRVSLWPGSFSTAFTALFREERVQPSVIPQYNSMNLFLLGGVSACAAMEYNEYHRIWQAGIDHDRLTTFLMRDYGQGLPEDGLYARADWVEANPGLADALRRATLAGWAYAREHPQEAVDLVMAQAARSHVHTNETQERWELEHFLASIFIAGSPPRRPGDLSAHTYADALSTLRSAGLLTTAPPSFADFVPLAEPRQ